MTAPIATSGASTLYQPVPFQRLAAVRTACSPRGDVMAAGGTMMRRGGPFRRTGLSGLSHHVRRLTGYEGGISTGVKPAGTRHRRRRIHRTRNLRPAGEDAV